MHDEVRSPAHDEAADDRQRHLDRSDLRPRNGLRVELRLTHGDAAVSIGDVLALTPDDAHDVDVAVGDHGSRDDEDVEHHEREVELPLPPFRVPGTAAASLDVAVRVDPAVDQLEDQQLRSSEDERQQPRHDDHLTSTGARRTEAQRSTDGHVAVDAHRYQDEGRTGERDDLHVQQNLAGGAAQHPRPVEDDEQHLRGHREAQHRQVTDCQVDYKHVHTPVHPAILATREREDDDDVTEEGQRHDDAERDDSLDDLRRPHLTASEER